MGRSEISREVEYTSSTQSGVCDFRTKEGLSIKLTIPPTVYPPRRDTELLLEGLNQIRMEPGTLVEIGCGSGAISIAKALEFWKVTAFDVNPLAVAASRGNSEAAGVNDRVIVEEGGVGEENWKLPAADIVTWNLPYLAPDFENTLGPMEEAGLSDEEEKGWSEKLLHIANDERHNRTIFVLLMNTDSNPKNSPLTWLRNGWSHRSLAIERVGDDTLEVIAFWRPGYGTKPVVAEKTQSTMDDARNLPKFGWQRTISIEQTNGRGRRESVWHSNQGDLTASWSIEFSEINRWPPGLLQVSIGASVSKALGVELKWPNDLFFQGKKCGGILLESSNYEGVIRIGVGLNKQRGELQDITYSGWTDYFDEIDALEMFKIIDASIASILDSTPPIESPEPEFWKQKSWGKLSESISRGVTAKFGQENVNVVGLSGTGGLKAYSTTNQYDISDLDNFSITF